MYLLFNGLLNDGMQYLQYNKSTNDKLEIEEEKCMQITSAGANKLLRKLEDDKHYILSKEASSCAYVMTEGTEALIPPYDYRRTAEDLEAIDAKVRKIKHALNVFNSTTMLEGLDITIDEALVKMAQLNQRKSTLDVMRCRLEKERIANFGRSNVVEYTCINYDLKEIQEDYQAISQQIMDIQLALDFTNQTKLFELEG